VGTGSFLGVNRPGRGVDHPPHLAPRLKKKQSYTSTPPWAFVSCSGVKFTFTFTFTVYMKGLPVFTFILKFHSVI